MGRSKIVYGGETLIDLTADTVTADTLLKGATAHDKAGEKITGTKEFKTQTKSVTPNTSAQTVKPDSGYDGLSQVTVNKISTFYNTYTPSSNVQDISIDFGFVPKLISIITATSIVRDSSYSYISAWTWDNTTGTVRQRVNYVCSTSVSSSNTGVTQGGGTGSFPSSISGTTFTWKLSSSTSTNYKFRFKSGATYHIYAWG